MYILTSHNSTTHTHPFYGPCPGLSRSASTILPKPIWILLMQETVSGSGTSWAICKSAPRSRQTTTPAPHHSVFYRPDALPAAQPTASKHWLITAHEMLEIVSLCGFGTKSMSKKGIWFFLNIANIAHHWVFNFVTGMYNRFIFVSTYHFNALQFCSLMQLTHK